MPTTITLKEICCDVQEEEPKGGDDQGDTEQPACWCVTEHCGSASLPNALL